MDGFEIKHVARRSSFLRHFAPNHQYWGLPFTPWNVLRWSLDHPFVGDRRKMTCTVTPWFWATKEMKWSYRPSFSLKLDWDVPYDFRNLPRWSWDHPFAVGGRTAAYTAFLGFEELKMLSRVVGHHLISFLFSQLLNVKEGKGMKLGWFLVILDQK